MAAIPKRVAIRTASLEALKISHRPFYNMIHLGQERGDPAALEIIEGLQAFGDDFILSGRVIEKSANGVQVGAAVLGGNVVSVRDNRQHFEHTSPLFSRDKTHKKVQMSTWRSHLAANRMKSEAGDTVVYQSIADKRGPIVSAAQDLGYFLQEDLPASVLMHQLCASGVETDIYMPDLERDLLRASRRRKGWLQLWNGLGLRIRGPSAGEIWVGNPTK